METITSYQLTATELATLKRDETTIRKGIKSFLEVGTALKRIKDQKLYLADHKTFREYCDHRWGITNKEASRQMISAGVVNDLAEQLRKAKLELPLPRSESVARELRRAAETDRVTVWQKAVGSANGDKVTAAIVGKFVPKPKSKKTKTTLRTVRSQVSSLNEADKRKLLEELEAQLVAIE